jgi:hypothetical protein
VTRGQGRIDRKLSSAKDWPEAVAALDTAESCTGKPLHRCGFSKPEYP